MATINSANSTSNAIYNTSSRITGMFSSLDTDALVKSMTSGQQSRIDVVRQKQIKREWYNDALKNVKADINEFLDTYVNSSGEFSMLKSASYSTYKSVTASTSNAASVTALSSADLSDITLQINKLAKNTTLTSSSKVSARGTEISANNTAALKDLSLATPLQFGSDNQIAFAINGKTFTFAKETTLQNMINTINTDKTANVTMKYSRLSDSFTLESDSGGADSVISITNFKGNAFGSASAFKIGTGTFKNGNNSEAVINGTTVTRNSNEFTIDSIIYDLKKVTQGTTEETVTFSLEHDTSSTVTAVTKFINAYNELFSKLADLSEESDNSSDYPPLTDAQKDSMSEEQITAWETKAKSGLLRHNKDLSGLMTGLKNAFYSSLGGTGKNSTEIGITTAGYFDSNPGQITLDESKLTEALRTSPDTVIGMFTNGSSSAASSEQGLIYKLKTSISKYTSSITNAMKTATKQITTYDTEISSLEDKLGQLADSYYAKFSRMETALSKLNSQSSYISQLFQ